LSHLGGVPYQKRNKARDPHQYRQRFSKLTYGNGDINETGKKESLENVGGHLAENSAYPPLA